MLYNNMTALRRGMRQRPAELDAPPSRLAAHAAANGNGTAMTNERESMQPQRLEASHARRCAVGESPVWRAAQGALYWVDIPAQMLVRYELSPARRTEWQLPERVGCIAFDGNGTVLAALETGLFALELHEPSGNDTGAAETGAHQGGVTARRLASVRHEARRMRFNDGRCDRQGRFWAGTMVQDATAPHPAGKLYRYDARGKITEDDWKGVEGGIARSPGHCMTMGTASTMTSAAEALGFTLPGFASIPAADSRHAQMAAKTGMRIVDMVWEDLKPSDIITQRSVDNAVTTCLALSGSTNAIVHMIALARRAGIPLTLDHYDDLSRRTPVLANIRPTGQYLMEDYYYAGGLRAMLKELGELIDGTQRTVNGKTLGENIADAEIFNDEVIRRRTAPLMPDNGLAVLRGNLAPDGAVIKPGAADPKLHVHTGRAVVFKDYNDMAARIDDDALDVDEHCVIVLQHAGPVGAPGMPEWGQLPIPKKLLQKGVRDMVRISDARMSGTSYGACVLHVAPESFIGGPLALVEDGDLIELDVPQRKLNVLISDEELARRKAAWVAPAPRFTRGYGAMHQIHVMQADKGCDFDFLQRDGVDGACGNSGEPEIH
jgi:dihydroxy-acid dehydratase